jgi:hypothetical protein
MEYLFGRTRKRLSAARPPAAGASASTTKMNVGKKLVFAR